MSANFEINGRTYSTDEETVKALRSIMPSAKKTNDFSAVIAMVELGKAVGRIKEIAG